MTDLSEVITFCRVELHRLGLTWRSPRVLDFCERVTGKRDAHYLDERQLQALLTKLQAESAPQTKQEEIA